MILPIRASCSYPGLFQPVRYGDGYLVDGAMTMEVPAPVLRGMGATHVISVSLPVNGEGFSPRNMFQVVNRCFQIMQTRTEHNWRRASNVVIQPNVSELAWDSFDSAERLIESGEEGRAGGCCRAFSTGWSSPTKKCRVSTFTAEAQKARKKPNPIDLFWSLR